MQWMVLWVVLIEPMTNLLPNISDMRMRLAMNFTQCASIQVLCIDLRGVIETLGLRGKWGTERLPRQTLKTPDSHRVGVCLGDPFHYR